MIWTLRKQFRFEAAHHLPAHDGKCARVHGHSWIGEVEVSGDTLQVRGPKVGMLIDYAELGRIVKPTVEELLDHHDLNLTTGLENPTSEELARFLFNWWEQTIPGLIAVTILETCTTACRYARH